MEELTPSVIETIKLLGLDDPKKIIQEIKFRGKIINYIKKETQVTQREISKKFSKKLKELHPILCFLEL